MSMEEVVMESILTSIKKLLGIQEEYTSFDPDIILHINTVFGILQQLGAGPANGFSIIDKTAVWDEYTTNLELGMIKTYVYLKVRLIFDPPTGGPLLDSIKNTINELEWRITLACEPKPITPVNGPGKQF